MPVKKLVPRAKLILLLPLLSFLSCISVKVNRGPFDIIQNPDKLEQKAAYLESLKGFEAGQDAPNILIILVDDLAKHDISLYDSGGVVTPNIERLANQGVFFSSAYTSSPVCSPSRAAMLTGRYQQRFGFERQPMNRYSRNRHEYFFVDHFINVEPMRLMSPMADVTKSEIEKQGIPEEEILVSEILQGAGYATGICGKWHLGNASQFNPNKRGFDYQYGFYEAFTLYSPENTPGIEEHHHDYYANKHIWRQQRNGSSAIRVNDSIVEEEEYLTFAIARESIEFIERNSNSPFFLLSAFNAPHTPFQVPAEYFNKFKDVEDHNKRVYYAMITALDDAIGMILDALERCGKGRNTLIIFASDNGGATYTGATENGPLRAGKFSQFEGGVNIPMIMKWDQKIMPGMQYSGQVSLIDVLPTMVAAAGLPGYNYDEIDGVDLLEKINHPEQTVHDYLYWRTDYNKAIRSKEWKLIWNIRDGQAFLYDVRENNYEIENLAEQHPEIVEKLKGVYELWEMEMRPPLWPGVMEFRFEIDGEDTWWAI